MNILELNSGQKIECSIQRASIDLLPKKEDGWSFNWVSAFTKFKSEVYILIELSNNRVHGCLQLKNIEGMLIMEIIELAPFNIGHKKEYDKVAGCLIAFSCREAIKLDSNYKGYLTFVSKSALISLYIDKYYATLSIGQRMYIDPIAGEKLINEYLN